MFKIGVGPSSSHTVGPMVAALKFRQSVEEICRDLIPGTNDLLIEVELFGSLSATGKGHATDGAICAGLCGLHPRHASPEQTWDCQPALEKNPHLEIENRKIRFNPSTDIIWRSWTLNDNPLPHPNTIIFRLKSNDKTISEQTLASVGGGFVERICPETGARESGSASDKLHHLPYPYNSAAEFVEHCQKSQLPAWQIVIANQEAMGLSEAKLREELGEILDTMESCIERGLNQEGILPGGLNVRRRAKSIYAKIESGDTVKWANNDLRPSVYAMAVNEENAAGGRVVTAPTNGSSGLIPAVWRNLREIHELSSQTLINGLIVASVIGALVKVHASISGAEVGCQGEVGTSCAMAAAGAVAMLGGTANQIEQAAEIGIEHHLGMTCDPIMGLVQVPCIERNAMGAVKALNAAALSLASDGIHLVSLDKALEVMKQTGIDMNQKYKETSTGGLALG